MAKYYFSEDDFEELAEHIRLAVRTACDKNGLKAFVPVDGAAAGRAAHIALQVATGADVVIQDPPADDKVGQHGR